MLQLSHSEDDSNFFPMHHNGVRQQYQRVHQHFVVIINMETHHSWEIQDATTILPLTKKTIKFCPHRWWKLNNFVRRYQQLFPWDFLLGIDMPPFQHPIVGFGLVPPEFSPFHVCQRSMMNLDGGELFYTYESRGIMNNIGDYTLDSRVECWSRNRPHRHSSGKRAPCG